MSLDPYLLRLEAERIIGEDRVPQDVLRALLADYGERRWSDDRDKRFRHLVKHFDVVFEDDQELPTGATLNVRRYAGVYGVGEYQNPRIFTVGSLEDALWALGMGVLEGFQADGVYDLDTGQKIDVHVAVPVVTVSEEQGITDNPLEDETHE